MNRPLSSSTNFNSAGLAPGLSRYQPSSITTYCQPNCFRCLAIHSAFARTWASVMLSLYESQLFQPMGGVGANSWSFSRCGTCAEAAGNNEQERTRRKRIRDKAPSRNEPNARDGKSSLLGETGEACCELSDALPAIAIHP